MQLGSLFLWLWCWPAVVVPIHPLAWEHPYAAGAALERKKKKVLQTHCVSGTVLGFFTDHLRYSNHPLEWAIPLAALFYKQGN